MIISEKEFQQEKENFKKHLEAGTLKYNYKFCRFNTEEVALYKNGIDAHIVALEDGSVRVALVDNSENLGKDKPVTISQKSTCC